MRLVPPYIETLEPYRPGKPVSELQRELGVARVVKLASNENPLGPSPLALSAMQASLPSLHLYPNGGMDLREELARRFKVRVENVIAGSGSEGIMSTIVRTFLCDDDEVLTSEGTFVGLYVLARSRGVRLVLVPQRNYSYDLEALAAAVTPRTKIIYIANPNNPTGTVVSAGAFEKFIRAVPSRVLVIMDEAYFEYAAGTGVTPDSMRYRFDNVITLRTFSKIYGLAGVRIGYGFGHDNLVANLLKVKLPFEPSTIAQAAGIAALDDTPFLERSLRVNREGKLFLTSALERLGLSPVRSEANFVMVPLASEKAVDGLYHSLLQRGVIIRPLRAFGLPHCVRITVGTREENEELLAALGAVLPAVHS